MKPNICEYFEPGEKDNCKNCAYLRHLHPPNPVTVLENQLAAKSAELDGADKVIANLKNELETSRNLSAIVDANSKLPEQGEDVLVFVDGYSFNQGHWTIGYVDGDGNWKGEDGFLRGVTHWKNMPGIPIAN